MCSGETKNGSGTVSRPCPPYTILPDRDYEYAFDPDWVSAYREHVDLGHTNAAMIEVTERNFWRTARCLEGLTDRELTGARIVEKLETRGAVNSCPSR